MEDCIFCKIVKGEIPSEKVYEDDKCLAFLNINPNNDGTTLLIPKKHYENYFETPDDILKHLSVKTKILGKIIKKIVGAEGMNIIINSETAAGQVIFHTHIHIIPRYKNDGYQHWKPKKYDSEKSAQIAEKIKKELAK
ncbi:MAG: HIT family protein [Candidatus Zambryskibacteria bacterium]|nr:HIT family protein [Candidatus Zambryskibacteria bacterium]